MAVPKQGRPHRAAKCELRVGMQAFKAEEQHEQRHAGGSAQRALPKHLLCAPVNSARPGVTVR